MPPSTGWSRYLTPTAAHRRLGLVCLGTGGQSGGLPTLQSRTLDSHGLVFLIAGRGQLRVGGTLHELVAPALFWLFPGVEHGYGPDEHGWEEAWALFTGSALRGYAGLGYLDPSRPVVSVADKHACRRAFDALGRVCRRGGPHVQVDAAAALHQLLAATRHARADHDGTGTPILTALQRDALLPLPVAQHAARAGLSLADFRAAVRRVAGCGPKDYLLRIRISHAKQLLAETDLAVAAISRQIGYDDPAYFTRMFSRHVGIAPTVFREQQQRLG